MKLLKLWRTFKEGFSNFYRNGWLSVATITIMTLSLYIISLTLMIGASSNTILDNFRDKVNISAYFNPGVEEGRILEIKAELEKYREIKSVEYISKERALEEFPGLVNDNPLIIETLDELDENPLLPSLVIKANESEHYEIISRAIENSGFKDEISRVTYQDNKEVIEKINKMIRLVATLGIALGIIFIVLAILITFNTIRITIYSRKQEFEVMRLVGASNVYVQMPFVFEGIFYGIFSSIFSILMLLVTSAYVYSAVRKEFIEEDSSFANIEISFLKIFLVLLISGVTLGVISGVIAIRRYLKK